MGSLNLKLEKLEFGKLGVYNTGTLKMRLFNLKFGKLGVYDIGTLVAGFYIGYNEGKGVNTSSTVEYLAKYGPTALAIILTPLMIKSTNPLWEWAVNLASYNLENDLGNEDMRVTLKDGTKKRYWDLSEDEKQKITPQIIERIKTIKSKLDDPKYLNQLLLLEVELRLKL